MRSKVVTFICGFFLFNQVHAGKAIVTTLEAPLLREPNDNAMIVQRVRKGQKIYIHDKHFLNGPWDVLYPENDQSSIQDATNSENEFYYETADKSGQTAYISSYFVKLIYNDAREFQQAISPFKPDPNDYRLSEPLPTNYPLQPKRSWKAKVSGFAGNDLRANYNYDRVIASEVYSDRYGLDISYGRKAAWDKEDRFYFGGFFQVWTSQAEFSFYRNPVDDLDILTNSTESKFQIGLGPYLSYDPWRTEDLSLTILGALMVNHTRYSITIQDPTADEQRFFSSISISPRFSTFLSWKTPTDGVDIVAGMNAQIYLPHSLTSNTNAETNIWQLSGSDADTVRVPFSAHWSFLIGVQSRY